MSTSKKINIVFILADDLAVGSIVDSNHSGIISGDDALGLVTVSHLEPKIGQGREGPNLATILLEQLGHLVTADRHQVPVVTELDHE